MTYCISRKFKLWNSHRYSPTWHTYSYVWRWYVCGRHYGTCYTDNDAVSITNLKQTK